MDELISVLQCVAEWGRPHFIAFASGWAACLTAAAARRAWRWHREPAPAVPVSETAQMVLGFLADTGAWTETDGYLVSVLHDGRISLSRADHVEIAGVNAALALSEREMAVVNEAVVELHRKVTSAREAAEKAMINSALKQRAMALQAMTWQQPRHWKHAGVDADEDEAPVQRSKGPRANRPAPPWQQDQSGEKIEPC